MSFFHARFFPARRDARGFFVGISLFEIGISLLTNRDFPTRFSVVLRNFAASNEDKGNAEVRPERNCSG